jgi:hypothetical protein
MVVQVSHEPLHARQGLGLGEELVLPRAHKLEVLVRRDRELQVLSCTIVTMEMEIEMEILVCDFC